LNTIRWRDCRTLMPIERENRLSISIRPEHFETENDDLDLEEQERITHNLCDDLNQLDIVEKVDLISEGKAPEGSKSGEDIVSWVSLLVTLATSGTGILPALVGTLQSWLTRRGRQNIIVQIGSDGLEITGASDIYRQKIID
jgi:hypothetical protein